MTCSRVLSTAVALLLSTLYADCYSASSSQTPLDPERLVREYVRRDANSERLSATATWFDSVVDWHEEPAYDTYTVIAGYRVLDGDIGKDTSHVPVSFTVLGWVKTGNYFTAARTTQTVTFVVVKTARGWLITSPQMNQHVDARVVLRDSLISQPSRALLDSLFKAGKVRS